MVFQACFRYSFMALTGAVLCTYIWVVKRLQMELCLEERFVLFLLFTLALYDNPFFIGAVFVRHWIFLAVDAIATVTYICTLLLVILVFTHRVLLRGNHDSAFIFYAPKLALVGAIWLVNVVMFTYVKLRQVDNPSDIDWAATKEYQAYFITCAVLVDVYLLWLLVLIWRIARAPQTLSYHAKRFRFMWFLTIAVIIFTAGCIFLYVFDRYNAAEFLAMYAVYNFYTYVLAYLFAPSITRASDTHGDRARLTTAKTLDDDVEVELPTLPV